MIQIAKYTDAQARIAASLIRGVKDVDELSKGLGLPAEEVGKEVAALIKLGVVQGFGKPAKYRVIQGVKKGVLDMKPGEIDEKEWPFRAHVIIEGQSKEREALANAQKKLVAQLKDDKLIVLLSLKEEDMVEEGGVYTILLEAEIATKHFEDMAYVSMSYGPSSLELVAPESFELKRNEAQGILMDYATMISSYMHSIMELREALRKKDEIIIK